MMVTVWQLASPPPPSPPPSPCPAGSSGTGPRSVYRISSCRTSRSTPEEPRPMAPGACSDCPSRRDTHWRRHWTLFCQQRWCLQSSWHCLQWLLKKSDDSRLFLHSSTTHTWSSNYAQDFFEFFQREDSVLVIIKHSEQLLELFKIIFIYFQLLKIYSHDVLDHLFLLLDAPLNMRLLITRSSSNDILGKKIFQNNQPGWATSLSSPVVSIPSGGLDQSVIISPVPPGPHSSLVWSERLSPDRNSLHNRTSQLTRASSHFYLIITNRSLNVLLYNRRGWKVIRRVGSASILMWLEIINVTTVGSG